MYYIACDIEGGKKLDRCPANLVSGLSGTAWDETEGMDFGQMKGKAGFAELQKRLDTAFKFKARTEMHHVWDEFFFQLN